MPALEFVLAEMPVNSGLKDADEQKLLAIGSNTEDQEALRHMAHNLHWRVWSVSTCWDAVERLASESVTAIFCDDMLEDGTWKDILKLVGTGAGAPPLIVTSRLADAFLWSEVLNVGGYDVLVKPFSGRDVAHVLRTISLQSVPPSRRTSVAGAH